MKKILLKSCIILSLIFLVFGCSEKKVEQKNNVPNSKSSITTTNESKQISQGIEYKNEKLGFSLIFPESWKGKYRVEENDMGIMVYFEPKEKIQEKGAGYLFGIINKSSKDLDEDHFDTVCDKRYFKTKDDTYVIGGPTGITFSEDNPKFPTYRKLQLQIPEVIKTIK
ncbi:hypothetical protein [Clostridium ganghwense]|uniref:Lipoprotein n=1 Tax=Clostridium ganghwense TaxID=312089 RepID=A0ABT4CR58_9CLOT|nr:hypothetical protein [Clostridium ganghwense]MCY6370706.1 hypothetical protein [Clostridium ganghwense]